MLKKIELHNFKSVQNLRLALQPLTVLTGLNGSGKSSVLQALALLKQSLRTDAADQQLVLRGSLLRLGRCEDVFFENADDKEIRFAVDMSKGIARLSATAVTGIDTLPLNCSGPVDELIARLGHGFQFIQADRMTPAVQYQQAGTPDRDAGWLGCGGEYTVDFLAQNENYKVSPKRFFPHEHPSLQAELFKQVAPTDRLLDQTSGWLQHLSPGVKTRVKKVDLADAAVLQFSYTGESIDSEGRAHRPSNVGFGLTYSLPIVVACLAAPPGALLMLENPEAHLHPRGQSALGLLLARCAADGVQIIVETHSDHLLNGIRIAAKRTEIANEDVAIHFFTRDLESGETTVTSPRLQNDGRLSDWPEGFFDEWDLALDQLLGA